MQTKKIQLKDLKPGMKIKSWDYSTCKVVYRDVVDVWATQVPPEDQVKVTTHGTTLTCSTNHPFMELDGTQVLPDDIKFSHRFITPHGITQVTDVTGCDVDPGFIDIEVEDTHTFFAAGSQFDEMVLTHNSQGGVRNASATVTYQIFHYEFPELIVLKNNQGTEENRVRHLDYSVVLSGYFLRRLKNGQDITFFDPNETPEVYEAFYRDPEEFATLYEAAEKNPQLKKHSLPAQEVFKLIMRERTNTGRIYLVFIDNVISHGPIDSKIWPIYQSNLCQEILIPTRTFERIEDDEGRIALCTLGSANWGKFKKPSDMRDAIHQMVRSLDNLLSYQDFLSVQSYQANEDFRPLGLGVTGLAHWHAKRGLQYGTPEALREVALWMEHQAYYAIEASIELAEEYGPCREWEATDYARGIFPIDKANETVRTWFDLTLDWDGLRERVKKTGIRNALLLALPPVESSSVCVDSTNGIEMPKSLISTKESKGGSLVQIVPEYEKLKNKYQLLWEQQGCEPYLKTAAVLNAFTCQAISTNTFYNPAHYPEGKIHPTQVLTDVMKAYSWGLKTLYYSLTNKRGAKAQLEEKPAEEPVTQEEGEEYCESCVL